MTLRTQLSFPEVYEQALVAPLFRPFAEGVLEDLHVTAGDRLLDVACGTGIVARLAKPRVGSGGKVVGVDVNPAMLAVARRVAPDIDWREGDSAALPLDDGEQFDLVVCQQGLQFFADKPAAVRQMRRALASSGRLAVSTWRPDEELPLLRQLRRVAERHVGPIVDRRHGFGDAAVVETLLRDAGLREVRSAIVSRTIRFADAAAFVELNAIALVGMSATARSISEDERARIVAAIARDSAETVRTQLDATGLVFELAATVVTARG